MTNQFPLPDDHGVTRIPNAVLAGLLDSNADLNTVTFALRVSWWLDRSRLSPRRVAVTDLRADRTLLATMGNDIERAMDETITAGYFVIRTLKGEDVLMLNTVSAARADDHPRPNDAEAVDGWNTPAASTGIPDAYVAYEQNIATLTPMIRDAIAQALQDFTDEQIARAIREAVQNDARNWSYVAAILRKWNRDGIPDERHTARSTGGSRIPADQLRKYLEQRRPN